MGISHISSPVEVLILKVFQGQRTCILTAHTSALSSKRELSLQVQSLLLPAAGEASWRSALAGGFFVSPKPLCSGAQLQAAPECSWQSHPAPYSTPRSPSQQWGAWGLEQLHQTQHHTGSQARQRQPGVRGNLDSFPRYVLK